MATVASNNLIDIVAQTLRQKGNIQGFFTTACPIPAGISLNTFALIKFRTNRPLWLI
jgi:hypothetical protein